MSFNPMDLRVDTAFKLASLPISIDFRDLERLEGGLSGIVIVG
jgi:hypothetical protein